MSPALVEKAIQVYTKSLIDHIRGVSSRNGVEREVLGAKPPGSKSGSVTY